MERTSSSQQMEYVKKGTESTKCRTCWGNSKEADLGSSLDMLGNNK